MPSYTPQFSSTYYPQKRDFNALLDAARPFLREQLELVDPALPSLITVLRSVGAGECFHKHGSFLSHLTDVYRILKLWCAPDPVARCGLLHSAYSNSYVNLAIFDAGTSRDYVRSLVGAPAERLIHLFCIVPRQTLIMDDLIFRYSDAELVEHLSLSEASLREAKENGVFDSLAPWRRKLQSLLPAGGIRVKHIKTREDVAVSRRMVAIFLLMSIADFSDQYFDYQDKMFDNDDGRLEYQGKNWTVLWPGTGKPGLWMNMNSNMGALYTLILREEEIYLEERKRGGGGGEGEGDRDEEIELVIPPVFDNCTKVLDAQEQIVARDLYWEAVCGDWEKEGKWERVEELLLGSCEKNPFVGEPHLVLAQVYLNLERYEEAEREAERGLRLIIEWGSSWDKRMTWEGWVAWGRVMLAKAKEKAWPHSAWGIINLGLVR
ncbi:uncharacterized protein [Elaeis guineensis]|uniref:Uncharacterized protein LOC105055462 n=1 Tax=Elaeis guineensis var. tenera TaxID=51953 RepID=A0A6I9S073_ELAGV|nr:uncharacterized protein LOC105055462 [Elaeis guineensis]